MTVSLTQMIIRAVFPFSIFARKKVCPGLFQGLGKFYGNAPIPMAFIGFNLHLPIRHFFADICTLISFYQVPADIVYIHFVPIQSPWIGSDVALYIVQKSLYPNAMCTECDALAVAKTVLNGGLKTCRLCADGLENTPVVEDLVYMAVGFGLIIAFISPPVVHGPVVLSAVFIYLGQHPGGVIGVTTVRLLNDSDQQLDIIEPRRERKAPDSHR